MTIDTTKGRVIGIGGVLFKSAGGEQLSSWYLEKLGLPQESGQVQFKWRSHEKPEVEHVTAWGVFPAESRYFDPSKATFMINYIVDDLDAILTRLKADGVEIDPKREECEYGRFAWIFDPDGNKIELWEPPVSAAQAQA